KQTGRGLPRGRVACACCWPIRLWSPDPPSRSQASRQAHRHIDLAPVALDQKRDALARLVDVFLQLIDRRDLLRADADDHVARLNARPRSRTGRIFDDQTAMPDFLLLVGRQRPKRETDFAAVVARAVVRLRG